MAFLLVEILLLSILSRIMEALLDPGLVWVITRPPSGHAYIPIYLWFSFRLFHHYIRHEPLRRRIKFTTAYLYKLTFTALMTYLLVTQYNYGDFQYYYVFPYWISDRLLTLDWDMMKQVTLVTDNIFPKFSLNSTTVLAIAFAGLFLVFPASLFGLALFSGTIIFLACLQIYKILEPYIEKKTLFFVIFFFAPSITLQLGYTGKETVIIPLLAAMFTLMHRDKGLVGRGLIIFGVFYVRFYQAFFLIVAWLGSRLTLRQVFSIRGIPILLAIPVAGVFIYRYAMTKIGGLGFDSVLDLAEFMSAVYDKGNLVLEPWPFPLTYLQVFRPFPWEAHNAMALIVALESSAFLGVVAYLGLIRYGTLRQRFKLDPFFRFMAMYVLVQILIFSYNENMGDLVRRKIYFMPLLVGLMCYRRMDPAELAAAAAGRPLRAPAAAGRAPPEAGPRNSAPPSPPA